jgi:CRP-like cAMP-binding protein
VRKTDKRVATLRTVPAFADCDDRQLAEVASLLDERERPEGTVLTLEGAPGRESFVLVEGRATVTLRGVVIGSIEAGQLIGEMALLNHQPRSATVVAATDVRLLVIGPQAFATLLDYRGVARHMASGLANRLRSAEGGPRYDEDLASTG